MPRRAEFSVDQLSGLLAEWFDDAPNVSQVRYGWREQIEGIVQGDVWIFVVVDAQSVRGALNVETLTCKFEGTSELQELLRAVSDDVVASATYDQFGRPVEVVLRTSSSPDSYQVFEGNGFDFPNLEPVRLWARGLLTRGRRTAMNDE